MPELSDVYGAGDIFAGGQAYGPQGPPQGAPPSIEELRLRQEILDRQMFDQKQPLSLGHWGYGGPEDFSPRDLVHMAGAVGGAVAPAAATLGGRALMANIAQNVAAAPVKDRLVEGIFQSAPVQGLRDQAGNMMVRAGLGAGALGGAGFGLQRMLGNRDQPTGPEGMTDRQLYDLWMKDQVKFRELTGYNDPDGFKRAQMERAATRR